MPEPVRLTFMSVRARARELAKAAMAEGRPLDWFEKLYAESAAGEATVPWADLAPNPHLVEWLSRSAPRAGRALDVGCGLGDNAEELARRGLSVTAFDISATAVDQAKARFSRSNVAYCVANLLEPPPSWAGAFDLVVETYTLQVLPPAERRVAESALRPLVAAGGTLLVIARGREEDEDPGAMPWPLTRREVEALETESLRLTAFEDFLDTEDPPVRRFRATFLRP